MAAFALLATAVGPALAGGPAEGTSDGPSAGSAGERVVATLDGQDLVPASTSAIGSPGAAPRPRSAAVGIGWGGRALRLATSPLVEETFESSVFPPSGWQVFDDLAGTVGSEVRHGWSRQTCQTAPVVGGAAAAWSVGGGSDGAGAACGSAYSLPVNARLARAGIDARAFSGGVRVDLRFWIDYPTDTAFRICVRPAPDEQADCFEIRDDPLAPVPRRQWALNSADTPIVFPRAAGQPDVAFYVRYQDPEPTGGFAGVFVDNIVVSGLDDAPSPTATRPSATPTPTRPTATPTPPTPASPTATATPSRTPPAAAAYLPLAVHGVGRDDLSGVRLDIAFGTAVHPDGVVERPGSHFPFGIMALCAKESWSGYAGGTRVRWQWYAWSGAAFEAIDVPDLNGSVDVAEADWRSQCVEARDQGRPVPIPINRYQVALFLGESDVAALTAVAEVSRAGPTGEPTLTPTWTPQPTLPASPTPSPVPGAPICRSVVTNGDFERGPSVGWSVSGDIEPRDPARAIRRGTDIGITPAGGLWLGVLGDAANGRLRRDRLMSELFELPDPAAIITATLNFGYRLVSDERPDGVHDDPLEAWLLNPDNQRIRIPRSGISEELVPPGDWQRLPEALDVTPLVTRRPGWDQARLMLEGTYSPAGTTYHLVDDVTLVVCVAAGSVGRDAAPSTGGG